MDIFRQKPGHFSKSYLDVSDIYDSFELVKVSVNIAQK